MVSLELLIPGPKCDTVGRRRKRRDLHRANGPPRRRRKRRRRQRPPPLRRRERQGVPAGVAAREDAEVRAPEDEVEAKTDPGNGRERYFRRGVSSSAKRRRVPGRPRTIADSGRSCRSSRRTDQMPKFALHRGGAGATVI